MSGFHPSSASEHPNMFVVAAWRKAPLSERLSDWGDLGLIFTFLSAFVEEQQSLMPVASC